MAQHNDSLDMPEQWKRQFALWWTTPDEDEYIQTLASKVRSWPDYLKHAVITRHGRSWGARFWVSPSIGPALDRLDPTLDFTAFHDKAGVLIRRNDLHLLTGLPGVITDHLLQPLTPIEETHPEITTLVTPVWVVQPQPTSPTEKEATPMSETQRRDQEYGTPIQPIPDISWKKPVKYGLFGFLALVILMLAYSAVYTINEAERGVVLSGGKLSAIVDPGVHFKMPIYQDVKRINLQTWTDNFPKLEAYSHDQQPASMRVSVTWSADPTKVADLYRTALTLDNVTSRYINTVTPNELENTFGKFKAEKLVQDRTEFVLALTKRIRESVPSFVQVISVQVENVNFSDAYEAVIEEKAKAAVAVDTASRKEERAAIDTRAHVITQQGLADAQKNQMIAEAEGIRARGEAEASAITAKANALKSNPQLIQLIEAERWNGSRATTIFGAATPLVNTK